MREIESSSGGKDGSGGGGLGVTMITSAKVPRPQEVQFGDNKVQCRQ